jgi:hypothetical protein
MTNADLEFILGDFRIDSVKSRQLMISVHLWVKYLLCFRCFPD